MKKQLNERFQELAGIKPLSVSKINELDFGQKASGFFGKAKAFLSNLAGKSDQGKEVEKDLKLVGLGSGGFTAYLSTEGKNLFPDPEIKYIIDKFRPSREQSLNQKVKVTLYQMQSWKEGAPFLAIQATFDLKQEEPMMKGKLYALNFLTGKYDFIKEFEEKGKTGIPSDKGDETIAAFQKDIDLMTQDPSSITVKELMENLKIEVSADETPEGETEFLGQPSMAEKSMGSMSQATGEVTKALKSSGMMSETKIKKSELRKLIRETLKKTLKKKLT